MTQYMDAVLLVSLLFPGDRGKAESEYGLVKEILRWLGHNYVSIFGDGGRV